MRKIKYYTTPETFYKCYDELMRQRTKTVKSPFLFHSMPLEDSVFENACCQLPALAETIQAGSRTFAHFKNIMRDVFQCIYSLRPVSRQPEELTEAARYVSIPVFEALRSEAHFIKLHSQCRGRAKLAACATLEFADRILEDIETIAPWLAKNKPASQILDHKMERLQQDLAKAEKRRQEYDTAPSQETFHRASRALAKAAHSAQQVKNLRALNEEAQAFQKSSRDNIIRNAAQAAEERSQMLSDVCNAWGRSASGQIRPDIDLDLIESVQSNDLLWRISQYLGNYRQLLDARMTDAYSYHHGEKYDITLGRNLQRVVPTELAYLSHPALAGRFLDKFSKGLLRQYQRRERITLGDGDVIICIDESSSMLSDNKDAWAKAIGCVLVEHAMLRKKNAAIIRFSRAGTVDSHIFRHDKFDRTELMQATANFFGGGTDYETPLTNAVSLLEQKYINRADIVFITDGMCRIHSGFCDWLNGKLNQYKTSVLGVLLDRGKFFDFTLAPFCKRVFRTSEMEPDLIAHELIN